MQISDEIFYLLSFVLISWVKLHKFEDSIAFLHK